MENFINSDYSSWSLVVEFGIIAFTLILGNILRRKVKFLRDMLFPTSIIAGFIGLFLKFLIYQFDIKISGQHILTNGLLEAITYHTIALGFIAMGLKSVKQESTNKLKGRPFKTGLLIVNTYLLQGIIGILITVGFSLIYSNIAPYGGLLLPMGFGQGPGQANNIGLIFESNGFINGQTFGLAIATLGTLWACVAGIFYINRRAKEGKLKRSSEEKVQVLKNSDIESSDEIPVSEAIDKMSIQLIFVMAVYAMTFIFINFITNLIGPSSDISRLIWGFNFIFGMLFAMVFKSILNFLRKTRLMKRKYTNEYLLNRITGVVFDFMIVASIMSIKLETFNDTGLWVTLLVMTTVCGLITYFYLLFVTKRVYPDYQNQAFASLFGNLTGTASNGIALLREIDPNFETPAADDLVTGSSTAIMFGAPILLITAVIYRPEWYWLWGSVLLMMIFFAIFNYFMLRKDKVK
ncbi:sodium/glutamate symporter [Acholeplasma hippikon]|uniref:Sodium/glutamate symporter n=1 Tax=Acholeplasma hippikon TaxID=264636 RepID=A0A449BIN5_9MOLU|nr:sodium/glutamate symporter [Acholeplasma hippikon]VEU82331.1 Sodium/glutamate symporter [Acholeplasma hippikon]